MPTKKKRFTNEPDEVQVIGYQPRKWTGKRWSKVGPPIGDPFNIYPEGYDEHIFSSETPKKSEQKKRILWFKPITRDY